jgi:Zn-dependent protease
MAQEKSAPAVSPGGIPLFRVAGIQLRLDYSWFIIFILILWSLSAGYFPGNYPGRTTQVYWIAGLVATLLFFVSIIVHELSHSLMAIRSGIKIPEIRLFIFGGIARISEDARSSAEELKIAIVGPLSSFALAALFWVIHVLFFEDPNLISAIFRYLAYINLALGIFNLVPAFPLDGGRVLRAVWWWKTGSVTRGTRVASDMGKWFAVALIILGAVEIFIGGLIGGLWLVFIGMFLRGIAEGGYQDLVMRQTLQGVEVKEVAVTDVVTVPPGLTLDALANQYFLCYGYKGFPVLEEDGSVQGVVSLENLQSVSEEKRGDTLVKQIMTPLKDEIRVNPKDSLADAFSKMSQQQVERLLVMENGRLAGLLTKTGLKRYMEIKQILNY